MDISQNSGPLEPAPSPGGKKLYKFILPATLVLVVAAAGLAYIFLNRPASAPATNTNQQASGERWSFGLVQPAFAQAGETGSPVTPAVPFAKVQISQIENLNSFSADSKVELSASQKAAIEDSGFFLANNGIIGEEPFRDDF